MIPDAASPVLGRPSPAASTPAPLRSEGTASDAAYRADGGEAGSWALRVASVSGVRHRLARKENEDAFGWAVVGDLVVAAVADGVGGVEGSAGAARAAVTAALAAGRSAADDHDAAVEPTRAAVVAANGAVGSADSGATTLVVAVAAADGHCRLARVGDSTALALRDGQWWELFTPPAEEGVAETATAALPDAEPIVELAWVDLAAVAAVVLVSDGVAGPLRDGPTTVGPAFAEALAQPPAPLALAALLDFSRQGCHDDRTLLGLWWTGAGADRAET